MQGGASIKEKLIRLRESKGLTQKELARELNLTQQAYSAYERGSSSPSLDIISSLADFYDVNTDYLLRDDDILKDNNILYSSLSEAIKEVLKDEGDRLRLEEFARYLLYRRKSREKKINKNK